MAEPSEIQVYAPKSLYAATGIKDVTMRAWKSRRLTAPVEIFATGKRSLYSFVEVVLFMMAKRLIDGGTEASEALRVAGACTDEIRVMLSRKSPRDHWIIIGQREGSNNLGQIIAVSSPDHIAKYVTDEPVSIVLNLGALCRETRKRLEALGEDIQ